MKALSRDAYLSALASRAGPIAKHIALAKSAVKATVQVIDRFDQPRHFTVPAGTEIRGFDPPSRGLGGCGMIASQ